MASTTQCMQCGVVLNVPDEARGRRLKCPHCGFRFTLGSNGEPSAESSFLLPRAGSTGSRDDLGRPPSSAEALPVSAPAPPAAAKAKAKASAAPVADRAGSRAGGSQTAGAGGRAIADALALLQENPKAAPRQVNAAEARSKARRCPTCGSGVPAGMSLCQTCGLDLETKSRVTLEDDLAPPPPSQGPSLPISVGVIGGISLLASFCFAVVSLALWLRGQAGYLYFVPVCLFGVFASIQFLRLRSARLLLTALTFGVAIDLVALVAMPIYEANNAVSAPIERPVASNGSDEAELVIPSVLDRLDTHSLGLGIGLLVGYAAVAIYLVSPPMKRHFR
jgi:hypothetical protein